MAIPKKGAIIIIKDFGPNIKVWWKPTSSVIYSFTIFVVHSLTSFLWIVWNKFNMSSKQNQTNFIVYNQ